MASSNKQEWLEAMKTEMASLKEHKVWRLVRPEDVRGRVLNNKRVPKIKRSANGAIDRFKARVTVAAFASMLKQGIDFAEKYSATARWQTILIILTVAANLDLETWLIDIKTFFLYGVLPVNEQIYMKQVEGFEEEGKEDWICLLIKSLYGHPAASYHAGLLLKRVLTGGGFIQSRHDSCLYVLRDSKDICFCATHVDDMPSAGNHGGLERLVKCLREVFEITLNKNPTQLLGVCVVRDRESRTIKLHQEPYANSIVAFYRGGGADSNIKTTPMDEGIQNAIRARHGDQVGKQGKEKEFQTMVGKLLWLFKCRYDLHLAVGFLTRLLTSAGPTEMGYGMRVISYLASCPGKGLTLGGTGPLRLTAASDADWGADATTSKSTSGGAIFLGNGGAIDCSSRLQKKVADSTAMAETFAAHGVTKSISFVMGVLDDMGIDVPTPIPMAVDNNAVIKQSKNAVDHQSSKHYRIPQAVIREQVSDGVIMLLHIDGDLNPADALTKPLGYTRFVIHTDFLMMGRLHQ